SVWYKRSFSLPGNWSSKRILIHFGAVDWRTRVWINGKLVGIHTGGQASFKFEITKYLKKGKNTIVVNAFDDTRSGIQASGKQSDKLKSYGCLYTGITGIWQTVWLEAVGKTYIENFKITPDPDNKCVHIEALINGNTENLSLNTQILDGRKIISSAKANAGNVTRLAIPIKNQKIWSIANPFLYNLQFELTEKKRTIDKIKSYFGQRKIEITGKNVLINGKKIFQRLVLDQGFYPDGIWTAPSDAALKNDIKLSMDAGFNGARLHQKVFEPRFLYHADKMGYIVWGEYSNWGMDHNDEAAKLPAINEWIEIIRRDYNHPSIVGWCPYNETPSAASKIQNAAVRLTKELDPTRPVIDTSGWYHSTGETDIYDIHDYDQNPETFKKRWDSSFTKKPNDMNDEKWAKDKPFFVSEYGGIGWYGDDKSAWGYGNSPKTIEEFYVRYEKLTNALLDNPGMFGFCYTQLTNVEQEKNGIYAYDRKPKFDIIRIKKINARKAAYEKNQK
ncbi:beta-galactosidase, partial [bacterium]|nr:beta-galactosidase [bacterium]